MASAKLTFEGGEREGEKVKIPDDGPLVLGKKEGARLELDEESASYHHARITKKGEKYVLEDMQSGSGTLLGGESVAIAPLEDGDVIQIGDTRLVFHAAKVLAPAAHAPGNGHLVAPKIDLDLPPPKEAPHFDLPEQKVVKVHLKTARERAKEAEKANGTGSDDAGS